MNVQVLVATTNQIDDSLIRKMNINTDAVITNQLLNREYTSAIEQYKRIVKDQHIIELYNFYEKGVGLNRNNALMRSSGDILVLADDDMRFYDDYEKRVIKAFEDNPKADVVIFNLDETEPSNRKRIQKNHYTKKIGYGAGRMAFRRESIQKYGVFFNLCFGGGTEYSCGEDTLFLASCHQKGLKVYCVTESLAQLTVERESTWFKGKDEKYYYDHGLLLAATGIKMIPIRLVKYAFQESHINKQFEFVHLLRIVFQGYSDYKLKKWNTPHTFR